MRIGPIMADVAGLELTPEDRELLTHPEVGGVILFARNYADHAQLRALCTEIKALQPQPLLLAVDYEGGRVQRFRVGFTRIPAMRSFGQMYAESAMRARNEVRSVAQTIARELGAFGIDLCFAPVLDRDCGISQVIGDRAFEHDPEIIITLARAFCDGLASAGMAATGKHFPGHGAVAADSHVHLPVDRREREEIERTDLVPFQALIRDQIPSLMMAHIRYDKVDEHPASLSRKWIAGYLRRRLKYRGAVFCDDLSMHGAAVAGDMLARAELALAAGCDMLPVCNDRAGLIQLLDHLAPRPHRAASRRLASLYRRAPETSA